VFTSVLAVNAPAPRVTFMTRKPQSKTKHGGVLSIFRWGFDLRPAPLYRQAKLTNRNLTYMNRRTALVLLASTAVAACAPPPPTLGPDGKPLPRLYRISSSDAKRIPFRVQDAVNALRQGAGLPPLELNSQLTAAAATHARDMSIQNRPWHFGSDGSSPVDRAARVGYAGTLLGETLSETYESELETVAAWMQEAGPKAVILDSDARQMGISYYQESNGKIWWVMNTGNGGGLAG
jgi:uncharacterized protein YkwD